MTMPKLMEELGKTAVSYHLPEAQWNEIKQCVRHVCLERAAHYKRIYDENKETTDTIEKKDLTRLAAYTVELLTIAGLSASDLEEYMKQKGEGGKE